MEKYTTSLGQDLFTTMKVDGKLYFSANDFQKKLLMTLDEETVCFCSKGRQWLLKELWTLLRSSEELVTVTK